MKILYLRTRFIFGLKAGGSVAHTSGVINALSENHEVEVVSNDELPGVKVDYNIVKPKKYKFLPAALNEIFYNIKLLSKKPFDMEVDAIYQRLSTYSFVGARLAKKNNIKFILEHNGSNVWVLKHWDKQHKWTSILGFLKNLYKHLIELPLVTAIENYNLRVAHTIVVVSEESRSQLIQSGVPESKIVFYPNGVDPSHYHPQLDGTKVRRQYNWSEDETVFGFIGTFGQWHGVDIMAKAIVLFHETYPDVARKSKFLLIGDGLMMNEVRETLGDLVETGMVVLTGMVAQAQAPTYLAACNVLVSPHKPNPDGTKFFGSPTKLFEYMALGKGIIASDLEQIGHILKHEYSAFMVAPGDERALAESFNWATSDTEKLKQLGENARKEVLKSYTWERHVNAIVGHVSGN
jgi:glycosyltransferase involved in cell wall biosynthesis